MHFPDQKFIFLQAELTYFKAFENYKSFILGIK